MQFLHELLHTHTGYVVAESCDFGVDVWKTAHRSGRVQPRAFDGSRDASMTVKSNPFLNLGVRDDSSYLHLRVSCS